MVRFLEHWPNVAADLAATIACEDQYCAINIDIAQPIAIPRCSGDDPISFGAQTAAQSFEHQRSTVDGDYFVVLIPFAISGESFGLSSEVCVVLLHDWAQPDQEVELEYVEQRYNYVLGPLERHIREIIGFIPG